MLQTLVLTLLWSLPTGAKLSKKPLAPPPYAPVPVQVAPFTLPALPFGYDEYSAALDAQTMTLHHTKHHQAYVDNLNKAVAEGEKIPLQTLLQTASKQSEAVRNHGGGHWNHAFFWTLLAPEAQSSKTSPSPALLAALNAQFGSLDDFKAAFEKAALGRFGSGWAWLILNEAGKLAISTTPNQDNPLMDVAAERGWPLLGVDVWEHAYYLRYQQQRGSYLQNIWKLINWSQVSAYYTQALGQLPKTAP